MGLYEKEIHKRKKKKADEGGASEFRRDFLEQYRHRLLFARKKKSVNIVPAR